MSTYSPFVAALHVFIGGGAGAVLRWQLGRAMTGWLGAPMVTAFPQELQDALAQTSEFPRRLGRVAEFAELVMHIARNTMLNGEVIRLDGAIRMQPK